MTFLIVLFVIVWVLIIIYSNRHINKDNTEFNDSLNKKQYKKIIDDLEKKLKYYFEYKLVMNTKFNLLITYFNKGDNNKAIDYLKNNKWYNFRDEVLLFKGIVALYEDNVELFLKCFNRLKKIKKEYDYNILDDLYESYKIKKNTAKTAKMSLPLIREIIKKY